MIEIRRHLGFCRYLPGFTGYANPPPRSGFCKEVASFQWDTGWVSPQIFDSAWVTRRFVTALGLGAFKFDIASPLASRGIRLVGVGLLVKAAHVIIVRLRAVIICKAGGGEFRGQGPGTRDWGPGTRKNRLMGEFAGRLSGWLFVIGWVRPIEV